jgi:hypothetical protein
MDIVISIKTRRKLALYFRIVRAVLESRTTHSQKQQKQRYNKTLTKPPKKGEKKVRKNKSYLSTITEAAIRTKNIPFV